MNLKQHRIAVIPFFILSWVLTSTAHAHMAAEGSNAFGNGALHPWITPGHVLVFVALALLLGQREPLDLKTPLIVFTPLSALALAWTMMDRSIAIPQSALLGIALTLGALVGLDAKLPRILSALLCAVASIGIALDSGVESGSGFTTAKILIGTWFSLNAAVLYLAICASHAVGKPWAKGGIRILGSWIVAISLMALAFSLRK